MKRVLLIISGGIAAYKSLELIRLLTAANIAVSCVLTRSGAQFVTPLSIAALTGEAVRQDLFSLTNEQEMGHIVLSRSADLLLVCPASADILAKMAAGMADDLAITVLLATDKPVMAVPAMNVRMWQHAATQANLATLQARGVMMVGPDDGPMACGEFGPGRLAEPPVIRDAVLRFLDNPTQATSHPLAGKRAVVTAGPTHEPIDPVRYIANRSSGKQGYALAEALAALGAEVTLVSGPTNLPDPRGMRVVRVETALEMQAAVQATLPADIAICAAAVADWRVEGAATLKMKKVPGALPPALTLTPNPDILAGLAAKGPQRPALVIGFAAETHDVEPHASAKRLRKGCDWIVANDVGSEPAVMGGAQNRAILITDAGIEHWPLLPKAELSQRLAARIAAWFEPVPPIAEGERDDRN